jgi:tetratricopeptide (TPR) repeat protein
MIKWRTYFLAIVFLGLLSGCGTGLKQRWGDFNAYYNTFYNAKISYKSGLRSMESQTFVLNPERPIRVHRTPVRAGQADFEKAILKSADILREHAASKWVDDALLLIGKSYFYQSQFFSAEQKFNEVLATTANPETRQQAVLWNGLNMLETNRITEGIGYLTAATNSDEYDWKRETLAELNLVLAQLYVEADEFALAIDALNLAIPQVEDERLRSRAHFLHGQLLQRSGSFDDALRAFRNVSRKYPEYALIFFAQVKQIEILRETGNYDQALRTLNSMARDDKNFDQIGDLNYEIARTLQYKGDVNDAFKRLNDVLYASIRPPTRETIAKSHFAIAELYRFDFQDFKLAAAHYDTASRSVQDIQRLPEYFNASSLARSFGDFSRLSAEIVEMDSLLHLASLPQDRLNQVIDSIRIVRQTEYERQQRLEQLRGTTLINTSSSTQSNTPGGTREFGFLSHRNPDLVRQASESFAALWDQRPLVDNWRRLQAVRSSGGGLSSATTSNNQSTQSVNPSSSSGASQSGQLTNAMLNIDLSAIPSDSVANVSMRDRLASAAYEIGNLYYLNLSLPDSALRFYDRSIYEFTSASIRPQAIYTKADIYLSSGDTLAAGPYITMMTEEYPTHRITERLFLRLELDQGDQDRFVTDLERQQRMFNALRNELISVDATVSIAVIDSFISTNPDSPFLDQIYMRKALAYANIASSDANVLNKINLHSRMRAQWADSLNTFELEKAQWRAQLTDSTLSDVDRESLTIRIDSTITPPNFDEYFPYIGAEWDSVRSTLGYIIEHFSASSYAEQARVLIKDLKLPDALISTPSESASPSYDTDREQSNGESLLETLRQPETQTVRQDSIRTPKVNSDQSDSTSVRAIIHPTD